MVFSVKYDWEIKDLNGFSETGITNSQFFSPTFRASSCNSNTHFWKICLQWNPEFPEHYGVYLDLADQQSSHPIYVKFNIKVFKTNGTIVSENISTDFDEYNVKKSIKSRGFFRCISISECKIQYVSKISLYFELTCQKPIEQTETLPSELTYLVQKDLLGLYESGDFSDTTIHCGEQDFRVHKIILAGRSTVFKAMFQTDMRENQTKTIQIDDVDPEAIAVFLELLYSGVGVGADYIPLQFLGEVLDLAERYNLQDIKSLCGLEIRKNIEVSTALKFLISADKYEMSRTKESILKYIKENLGAVKKNNVEEWESFLNNRDLVDSLFTIISI